MNIFDESTLEQVSHWLDNGNLLAYPTEAVWGMGCDPFNEQAVRQILTIKNRPIDKGMILITADTQLIKEFFHPLPATIQNNLHHSWQNAKNQATTYLLPIPAHLDIPDWVTGGRATLAIRVINHPIIAKLCQTLAKTSTNNPYGFLISTSCNPSGKTPATTLRQAQNYFGDSVGYFDAPTLGYTQPSQIKDALTGQLIRL